MKKRILAAVICLLMGVTSLSACNSEQIERKEDRADISDYQNTTHILAGVDDLGRRVDPVNGGDSQKQVGIFYFLWLGASSAEGPYDVSSVLEKDPNAAASSEAWAAAGGGDVGQRHWWGESLFGYYRSNDSWVAERDVMMLTDAGVDFLALDYSNATQYPRQLVVLLEALNKYYQQGYQVPKVTFITKASSGKVVMDLYAQFYKARPEYSHLWYCLDGKPLMIGNENDSALSEECRSYFTWRYNQWPREAYREDGFPWMDFSFPQKLYGTNGTTIMSVSLAQHSGTKAMSSSALYGDTTNHTRSWHDGANDTAEDAVLYGYNFAEQFENAIEVNPDIIFVTGWNEWIATRQANWTDMQENPIEDPVILVDNCNINNSRDIQPMNGGYGDNYYMQLVNYIRLYKGVSANNTNLNTAASPQCATIKIKDSFAQWDAIESFYLDYEGDTAPRNYKGFGSLVYTDDTGRNDIVKMKMTNDGHTLYVYVQTAEDIVGLGEEHCMSLFLSTGVEGDSWCGYDYVMNRIPSEKGLLLEKRTADGWTAVGTVNYRVEGNEMHAAIPLSMLGLSGTTTMQFKWADNYQGEDDIFSFYLNGDSAPYGRLNFVYSASGVKTLPTFDVRPSAEIGVEEDEKETDASVKSQKVSVKSFELAGAWSQSRLSADGKEEANVGPSKSIDGNTNTQWNPCAASYAGEPAIIYALDDIYIPESFKLTFSRREYFFRILGSEDGVSYTELASVDASNYQEYFNSNMVCRIGFEEEEFVRYIKIVFTGSNSADNTPWICLAEFQMTGFLAE